MVVTLSDAEALLSDSEHTREELCYMRLQARLAFRMLNETWSSSILVIQTSGKLSNLVS